MAFNWTDENVHKLRVMWSKGLSARQIGAELGGISRNSVIGKANRMGLSSQKNKKIPHPQAKVEEQNSAKAVRQPIHITPHFSQHTDKLCQWPLGDPGTPEFSFCYREAVEERPYCAEHCELAYRKS